MKTTSVWSIVALSVVILLWSIAAQASESAASHTWKPVQTTLEDQLRSAACAGDVKAILPLLAKGADVNSADFDGWTPLAWGTSQNRWEVVALLLARGADVNYRAKSGNTPLMTAAILGLTDMIEILLAHGAKIEAINQRGWTPLMEASARGQVEVAKLLMAQGADPNFKGRLGFTPLALAVVYEQPEVAELLLAKGAKPDSETQKRLAYLGIGGFGAPATPITTETETVTVVQFARNSDRRGITATGRNTEDKSWWPRYVAEILAAVLPVGSEPARRSMARQDAIIGYPSIRVSGPSGGPVRSWDQRTATSGLSSMSDKYVEAESLLRQGLEIWNRLRNEYPETARRLQEMAQGY